ncbi:uncharacterized protein LOC128556074 [Mercenaria mercenaria]|uniref:uncharacterized protein LOC128556074 n=1 Tax=Mercenaria mercenaria TaxID=6596 RepID=UPI00234F7E01|nr:uncharacterized protein LOC128556074 [Mercenaria mercenaria]
MKANHVAAKILGGTDSCKLLYFSQLTGFEPGNEYLEKTTKFDYYTSPATFKETVQHILFSEVKVGDKFQFVIQKSNTDKFGIVFNDATKTTMLSFQDRSNQVILKDVYNGTIGEMKIAQSYPFADFKEYKIVFQVLELHWQIIIDDVAFTTFTHRYPFTQIRKIKVMIGHAVTYLTKAFDPRLPE